MSLKRKGEQVFTDVSFGETNNKQHDNSNNRTAVVVVVDGNKTSSTTTTTTTTTNDFNLFHDTNDENNPSHLPPHDYKMNQLCTQLQGLSTEFIQQHQSNNDPILEAIYDITKKTTNNNNNNNANNKKVDDGNNNNNNVSNTSIIKLDDEDEDENSSNNNNTNDDDNDITTLLEESNKIRQQLSKQLNDAKVTCQEESERLVDVENQLLQLKQKRQSLHDDMKNLDLRQIQLQKQIQKHQDETTEEIESIDTVEEERKKQVPRLKTQLSLYAATTGIKWDFENDTILSGQVAVPSEEGIKLFSVDPEEKSTFDVANHLWQLMEGSNPNCP